MEFQNCLFAEKCFINSSKSTISGEILNEIIRPCLLKKEQKASALLIIETIDNWQNQQLLAKNISPTNPRKRIYSIKGWPGFQSKRPFLLVD
jgi:hypothetical protein